MVSTTIKGTAHTSATTSNTETSKLVASKWVSHEAKEKNKHRFTPLTL